MKKCTIFYLCRCTILGGTGLIISSTKLLFKAFDMQSKFVFGVTKPAVSAISAIILMSLQ